MKATTLGTTRMMFDTVSLLRNISAACECANAIQLQGDESVTQHSYGITGVVAYAADTACDKLEDYAESFMKSCGLGYPLNNESNRERDILISDITPLPRGAVSKKLRTATDILQRLMDDGEWPDEEDSSHTFAKELLHRIFTMENAKTGFNLHEQCSLLGAFMAAQLGGYEAAEKAIPYVVNGAIKQYDDEKKQNKNLYRRSGRRSVRGRHQRHRGKRT